MRIDEPGGDCILIIKFSATQNIWNKALSMDFDFFKKNLMLLFFLMLITSLVYDSGGSVRVHWGVCTCPFWLHEIFLLVKETLSY